MARFLRDPPNEGEQTEGREPRRRNDETVQNQVDHGVNTIKNGLMARYLRGPSKQKRRTNGRKISKERKARKSERPSGLRSEYSSQRNPFEVRQHGRREHNKRSDRLVGRLKRNKEKGSPNLSFEE